MQQRKWSRGVFGLLFEVYPRLLGSLTWSQRIAYLVRGTYYLIGPLFALHAFLAIYVLLFGSRAAVDGFAEYLVRAVPLAASVVTVRALANLFWNVQRDALGFKWRGYTLAFALWPVYTGHVHPRAPAPPAAPHRDAEAPHRRGASTARRRAAGDDRPARARPRRPPGRADRDGCRDHDACAVAMIAIQGYAVRAALRP